MRNRPQNGLNEEPLDADVQVMELTQLQLPQIPTADVPRLRGLLHMWASPAAYVAGIWLALTAPSLRSALACAFYAFGLGSIFLTSALYHRVRWATVRSRRRMRLLDHSMIFVGMACVFTAVYLSALSGTFATVLLVLAWLGALAGVLFKLRFLDMHNGFHTAGYVLFSVFGLLVVPDIAERVGSGAVLLLLIGGACYVVGGLAFALGRPNPFPRTVGYHEIFHALTIVGFAIHLAAFAAIISPN